jgi:rubrerythrin
MTEEDEAFNEIERRAKQRMEAVKAAMRGEDDDIQEYKKPWVGLTDEEVDEVHGSPMSLEHSGLLGFVRAIEDALRKKNI